MREIKDIREKRIPIQTTQSDGEDRREFSVAVDSFYFSALQLSYISACGGALWFKKNHFLDNNNIKICHPERSRRAQYNNIKSISFLSFPLWGNRKGALIKNIYLN